MNTALMRAFWQQRIRSRTRMAFILLWLALQLGHVALLPITWGTIYSDGYTLALFLGFGMISQDVSSGAAQLILARPVRRFEYVVSRIGGVVIATLVLCGIELGAVVAIASARGAQPAGQEIFATALSLATAAIATGAVVGLWSCLARGLGDVAILAALYLLAGFLDFLIMMRHLEWARGLSQWLWWIARPIVTMNEFQAGGSLVWKGLLKSAALIAASVGLGYARFRRRELTYSD